MPDPRPRPRPGRRRRRRQRRRPATALTDELDIAQLPRRARGARPRSTRRRAPSGSSALQPQGARSGAAATTSRPSSTRLTRRARSRRTSTRSSPPTRWGAAGWAPTRRPRVANPWGELHDTPGVWIGDASAFPTASGHQPDAHDHGAGAPHRRGDRRRPDPRTVLPTGPANGSVGPPFRRQSVTFRAPLAAPSFANVRPSTTKVDIRPRYRGKNRASRRRIARSAELADRQHGVVGRAAATRPGRRLEGDRAQAGQGADQT